MEVLLPENISEITLRQFVKHEELIERKLDRLQHDRRKVSIFTNIPYKTIKDMRQQDYQSILTQIDKALSVDVPFTDRFTMHDITFGFIPNLDKITSGEFADLTSYGVANETLHKTMAVLFRPIIRQMGDTYEIMPYEGTEHFAEMMKDMPINCVNGALVFFYNLANDLETATQRYLTAELLKEMQPPNTSRILAGTRRLRNWLMTIYSRFRKSQS